MTYWLELQAKTELILGLSFATAVLGASLGVGLAVLYEKWTRR